MKSFHQFVSESQEVGVRSASTSGTVGGDSGFQSRQQQGVSKFVKKGADATVGKAASAAGAVAKKVKNAARERLTSQGRLDRYKRETEKAKQKTAARNTVGAAKQDRDDARKAERKSGSLSARLRRLKGTPERKALPAAKNEAYDPEVVGRSQIKRSGEGGRVGADRRKSEPERRRMKAIGGGKTAPVAYKDRKDIGQQRQRSTREQQPTQERGSAASAQAAAAKEARKKAARERIAAKKAGATHKAGVTKTSGKDAEKQATKLLSTKKPEKKVSPDYKPQKASGMTRSERMSQQRKGEAVLKDIMKKQETDKYKKETGQNPDRKGKTKILGRVAKRMSS